MPRGLKKHTLNLREGDWDYIESIAKPNGIATSAVVRVLISNYVDRKRADDPRQTFSDTDNLPKLDLEA